MKVVNRQIFMKKAKKKSHKDSAESVQGA